MTNINKGVTSQNRPTQISNQNLINNYLSYIYPSLSSKTSPDKIIQVLSSISKVLSQSNPDIQRDFYLTLSQKGLTQIFTSILNSQNETIRKLSTKIIIDLLYNNEKLQTAFCEQYNFTPVGNVVCLNWIPKQIRDHLNIDENMLYHIRSSQNIKNKNAKYWVWPNNDKFNDDNYPDPYKYFIGFYLNTSANITYEDKGYRKVDISEIVTFLEKENIEENQNVGSMTTSSSLTNHQKEKFNNGNTLVLSEKKQNTISGTNRVVSAKTKKNASRSIECKTSRPLSNYVNKYKNSMNYHIISGSNSNNMNINKMFGEKNYKFKY